ncbi:MAG: 30S ribosomal protein S7 [Candidatus Magasanikbacteria bacterium GW2011_GWC2_34_16]|uniref:Small ribosomal subunit protein uS7 n=2 Tax=Candidatus Magasanikiibacteriota TaxID=1752731 RepID=A0A0G0KEL3_9BACT|nr:MAG: 30S ribosomal protein S7 [Candidatus Magasanikbacteria bacterium GW2011_GWC2_34_16]KKQ39031.1 MAG: 30S ribosomal protein S7 [Candidatus Magasanikbacteria bacterium GW2011_GWA2_37_8]
MSRGNRNKHHRDIKPDPKFGNVLLAKFTNYLMERGKKTVAQDIIYKTLEVVAETTKKDPIKVFEETINTIRPQVEVRSRRVGGANYQVPMPVRGERQNSLAFRWIIGAARNKKGQPMYKKLATVLIDTSNNTGDAVKKRDDVNRMADANKAFAHFARFAK